MVAVPHVGPCWTLSNGKLREADITARVAWFKRELTQLMDATGSTQSFLEKIDSQAAAVIPLAPPSVKTQTFSAWARALRESCARKAALVTLPPSYYEE